MKITIPHRRWNEAPCWEGEAESLRAAVESAVRDGARLDGARLDGASLDGARLVGASLVGASLVGARLDGARLVGARLVGARLVGASLVGASLVGARLDGASLVGAKLDDFTVLPGGETWLTYRADVVPALLTAGGRSLADVLATGCWECHEWPNCPMHAAFGIARESDAPALLRPRVREFVQLFDALLIPRPTPMSDPLDSALETLKSTRPAVAEASRLGEVLARDLEDCRDRLAASLATAMMRSLGADWDEHYVQAVSTVAQMERLILALIRQQRTATP